MTLLIFMTCVLQAGAYEVRYEYAAQELWKLGSFLGSDGSFRLDEPSTRAEAAVMVTRLLGKESEAKQNAYEYPFTDVPDWASAYVGYLYVSKFTSGISDTEFGSSQELTSAQYITMILRVLGYKDGVDFTWDNPYDLALSIGLIGIPCHEEYTGGSQFLRDNVAMISYAAIGLPKKGETESIGKTISFAGTPQGTMPVASKNHPAVEANDGLVTAKSSKTPNGVSIIRKSPDETSLYGTTLDRVFILESGNHDGELTLVFDSIIGDMYSHTITVAPNSRYKLSVKYELVQSAIITEYDTSSMPVKITRKNEVVDNFMFIKCDDITIGMDSFRGTYKFNKVVSVTVESY